MIAAPIMTITMIIATIPYMSVLFEAKPLAGVADGGDVAGGVAALKAVVGMIRNRILFLRRWR